MTHDKLWTKSFIFACFGNFLLCFAFNLLLPIIPLYLIETFQTPTTTVGIILSCYTVAALAVRPFSGFLLDGFNRKKVYLLAYFLFVAIFFGYVYAKIIALFVVFRILHGAFFGVVTTAGNTLAVDITPSSRRGEGLGYYGISNNLAFATGPMLALFMHNNFSFDTIFFSAIGCGFLGLLFASYINVPKREIQPSKEKLSFDRFFLLKGLPAGAALLFLAVPYGMTMSYGAIYVQQLGLEISMGFFFTIMALGLISSRLFAGKLVDRGKIPQVIASGMAIVFCAFLIFSLLGKMGNSLCQTAFFLVPILLGVGYGMVFPAFNTLFVNLAPNNRRATASSTYLTSWDLGIGLGLVLGGRLNDLTGTLQWSYICGSLAAGISLLLFTRWAAPHFLRNRLR